MTAIRPPRLFWIIPAPTISLGNCLETYSLPQLGPGMRSIGRRDRLGDLTLRCAGSSARSGSQHLDERDAIDLVQRGLPLEDPFEGRFAQAAKALGACG